MVWNNKQFPVAQFWRLEVWGQGVGNNTLLPLKVLEKEFALLFSWGSILVISSIPQWMHHFSIHMTFFTCHSPCVFASSSLYLCLSVQIFTFYRDTSHTGLRPSILTSFKLDFLMKTLFPNKLIFEGTEG